MLCALIFMVLCPRVHRGATELGGERGQCFAVSRRGDGEAPSPCRQGAGGSKREPPREKTSRGGVESSVPSGSDHEDPEEEREVPESDPAECQGGDDALGGDLHGGTNFR